MVMLKVAVIVFVIVPIAVVISYYLMMGCAILARRAACQKLFGRVR